VEWAFPNPSLKFRLSHLRGRESTLSFQGDGAFEHRIEPLNPLDQSFDVTRRRQGTFADFSDRPRPPSGKGVPPVGSTGLVRDKIARTCAIDGNPLVVAERLGHILEVLHHRQEAGQLVIPQLKVHPSNHSTQARRG
jgi:hypothetical protein